MALRIERIMAFRGVLPPREPHCTKRRVPAFVVYCPNFEQNGGDLAGVVSISRRIPPLNGDGVGFLWPKMHIGADRER